MTIRYELNPTRPGMPVSAIHSPPTYVADVELMDQPYDTVCAAIERCIEAKLQEGPIDPDVGFQPFHVTLRLANCHGIPLRWFHGVDVGILVVDYIYRLDTLELSEGAYWATYDVRRYDRLDER